MKTAKLGALFLISIMALAGVGAGYAAWTDTLYIYGDVETGDVDINFVDLSGTWVYKVPDHGVEWIHGWGTIGNPPYVPQDGELIAYAAAEDDGDDEVYVEAYNLFPGYFMVDFLIHYDGSIPVRLDYWYSGSDWICDLMSSGDAGFEAYEYDFATYGYDAHSAMGSEIDLYGYQMHFCDYIYLKLWIDIPQDSDYMDIDGEFWFTIQAIQWNEW